MAEEKENKIKDIFSGKSEFEIPKIDTSGIDEAIRKISTPAKGGGVYEKLAAMYIDKGEGAFLRRQKNIANVFGPALELYKQRKNAADEAFATNLENSPEVDDSYIFGEQTGTPMPITDEIKGLSDIIRKDLRDLSNLNPTDPRYAELRKKVEQNQDKIVKFNDLNKKILGIRNSEVERENWSGSMKEEEARMWDDIYSSNGKNIQIIDGKPTYVDPVNGAKIDLTTIGDSPVEKNEQAAIDYNNYYSIINGYSASGGTLEDYNYANIIGGAFRFLGNLDNTKISSLIFDGYNLDPILGSGPVTTEFLNTVIQQKYGDEIDTPEEFLDKLNELKRIGINKAEFGEEGNKTLRQLFLEHEQQKATNLIKSGDVSTVFTDDENTNTGKKNKKDQDDDGGGGAATSSFEDYTSTYGDGKTYLPSTPITLPIYDANGKPTGKTRRFDADKIEITFEKGQPMIQFDPDDKKSKMQMSRDETIKQYVDFYGEDQRENIEKFVDEQIELSISASSKTETSQEQLAKNKNRERLRSDGTFKKIEKITAKGNKIGDKSYAKYILEYDDSRFSVVNSLNKEYKNLGFKFSNVGTVDDMLEVTYTDQNGKKFKFSESVGSGRREFDNMSRGADLDTSSALVNWMKSMLVSDVKKLKN
tara:strand:- start:727 stop:2664 length:1938 start_codon:yes stop_codon:yes gene_type:complete